MYGHFILRLVLLLSLLILCKFALLPVGAHFSSLIPFCYMILTSLSLITTKITHLFALSYTSPLMLHSSNSELHCLACSEMYKIMVLL